MRARMESTSDFLLVHRARAGDEEACERLVRKYYPSIYQYCLLHIYDTYEAEDLTQEVFARAFASLDRYREYGKVKNYLYTIAGNVVKNYYKKEKRYSVGRTAGSGNRKPRGDGWHPAGYRTGGAEVAGGAAGSCNFVVLSGAKAEGDRRTAPD